MGDLKGKKIVFCLPGRQFSNNFLISWTKLMFFCQEQGIEPIISVKYSPLIYYVRNACLGGSAIKGVRQKPFQGILDYDYIMWIDSDQVFEPFDFYKLFNSDKDIISGLYLMSDNQHYATVKHWEDEFFKKNGTFQFLSKDNVTFMKNKKPFIVDYTGFGWMLVKKGVFESLEYPWFRPFWTEYEIEGEKILDFSMEDVAFCKMIKEKGFDIWVDPQIIVGHEKMVIL